MEAPASRTGALSQTRWLAVALATIAVPQLVVVFGLEYVPHARPLLGDEVMYWDLATRWAAGEPAELDLLWPPLYPTMLATAMQLGGTRMAIGLMQVTLFVATAGLFHQVTLRLCGPWVAVFATAFLVFDSQMAAFSVYLWPEVLHLLLVTGACWIAVARPTGDRWSLAMGASLGLALLCKNLLTPLLPMAALAWLAVAGREARRRVALAAIALVAVTAPTVLANGTRHGAYVVADSALFNVWVGLNDTSRQSLVYDTVGDEFARYRASGRSHEERQRVLARNVQELIAHRGLWAVVRAQLGRQLFRLFDRDSYFTAQLPGGVAFDAHTGYHAIGAGAASWARAWSYGVYGLALALAPFGVRQVWRRHRPAAIALLTYVGYIVGVCVLVHVKSRYRVQLMPAVYVFAGAAAAGWWTSRVSGESGPRRSAGEWVACASTSASLLVLAFGREWVP